MAIGIGYAGKVEVADDTAGALGTWAELGGSSEGEITPKNNDADVTQVGSANAGGFDQSIPTTQTADIKAACFLKSSTDAGYVKCATSLRNRVPMWIRVWRDGTSYNIAYVNCTSVPSKIDPKAPNKVDFGFKFSGNPNGNTINNGLTGVPYSATTILGFV